MIKKSQGYRGRIDMNVCSYCGDPVDNASRTTDHLIPESRGGIKANDNRVPACAKCNMTKGDMTPEEFKKFLERVIDLEFRLHKLKVAYFKKVQHSCREIINRSQPREINIPDA